MINVRWDDAQQYVAWLAKVTGKSYRLLTEAEHEYATRAGTTTAYPWGDEIKLNGQPMANCAGCGSKWDRNETAPAGSFPPNMFDLFDMVGNVWEWAEDCYHDSYNGAPADGSAWIAPCSYRWHVLRGGSWPDAPRALRSTRRLFSSTDFRDQAAGFRVARTLDTR